jgi:hypothetical protein
LSASVDVTVARVLLRSTTIGSVSAGSDRTGIELALSGIRKRFGANVVLDV